MVDIVSRIPECVESGDTLFAGLFTVIQLREQAGAGPTVGAPALAMVPMGEPGLG
jgi:hypothetical protein